MANRRPTPPKACSARFAFQILRLFDDLCESRNFKGRKLRYKLIMLVAGLGLFVIGGELRPADQGTSLPSRIDPKAQELLTKTTQALGGESGALDENHAGARGRKFSQIQITLHARPRLCIFRGRDGGHAAVRKYGAISRQAALLLREISGRGLD